MFYDDFCGPSPHPRTRITNCFPSSLLTFDGSIRSFGQGFIRHQQSRAILYHTRGEFHCIVKANVASELWAEIRGIVWLLDIERKFFPRKWPEERIPSTDWSSYLRRCLRAEFVCEVRYFCKRCFLETNFSLYRATSKSYNSKGICSIDPKFGEELV